MDSGWMRAPVAASMQRWVTAQGQEQAQRSPLTVQVLPERPLDGHRRCQLARHAPPHQVATHMPAPMRISQLLRLAMMAQ